MKILVTGGAGYIGSHTVKKLLEEGYDVVTLDDLSTGDRDLVLGGEFVEGDVGDVTVLDNIFQQHTIDAVIHLAAFALVGESVGEPLNYYKNNVSTTIILLDAMRRHNVDCLVFASTADVYGEPVELPITETHGCNPTNPYGRSKLMVENILAECEVAFGLKHISLRYFNVAGADESGLIGEKSDSETHLIPLVLKVASGESDAITIYGVDYETRDGTYIRDYIHINDLTQAHLLTLESLILGNDSVVYNLGSDGGHTVKEVIDAVQTVTGKEIPIIKGDEIPGDPSVLVVDSTKIKDELNWAPQYEDLETIISTTWNWYQTLI